jgi:hypothetical protein
VSEEREDRCLSETVIIRLRQDFQEGEISEAITPRSRPWKRGLGTRSKVRLHGKVEVRYVAGTSSLFDFDEVKIISRGS